MKGSGIGPAGRRRKPHALRKLEGGRGHSRPVTPDLPAPAAIPDPPEKLTKAERAEWDRHVGWVAALKLASPVDAGNLLAMIRLYLRATAADRELEAHGLTYESETQAGLAIRPRPEVAISRDCWSRYCALSQLFGLTPAARAKFSTPGAAKETYSDVPPELRDASAG